MRTLSDISWLLGFTERLMSDPQPGNRIWMDVRDAMTEAIQRGEVVPLLSNNTREWLGENR